MTKGAQDRDFDSLKVGDSANITHHILEKDVDLFAELSGDRNPLHVDSAYASSTTYGKRVVHGMFLGALVSQLVGMHLPGKHSLLVRETLEFKKPVHIGDTIIVKGTLVNKSASTRLIELSIAIERNAEKVTTGSVHVRIE